jgi:hypothetical protein
VLFASEQATISLAGPFLTCPSYSRPYISQSNIQIKFISIKVFCG